MPLNIPSFDDLPPVPGMPKGCAWGVFEKAMAQAGLADPQDDGKDVFGTLNLLTPDMVTAAAREVREGVSVSLNWAQAAMKRPTVDRCPLKHNVVAFTPEKHVFVGLDDEVAFNTQISSQWDSLVHYPHQATGKGYNDASTLIADAEAAGSGRTAGRLPTLEHWHRRGGLVGRGVLIDYKRYAARHGIAYSPFSGHAITVADIEAAARDQNSLELRPADILIVRCGFTEGLDELDADGQAAVLQARRCCGIEGSEASARWFWDRHFSAAAGDSVSFEVAPPQVADGQGGMRDGGISEYVLHPYLLSFFGMPIGELWDLKALAEQCEKSNRWSFFLTSMPLNVSGSVGSPSNVLAVF
ncbi:hypothetical protein SCUCBS95973_007629 [Sporothrix curviconia]|uniref:Cyclase n=1 Tax=Sporothrix curviconia TaxID=1260050 RepID=A0ABP0CG32_9PEZI